MTMSRGLGSSDKLGSSTQVIGKMEAIIDSPMRREEKYYSKFEMLSSKEGEMEIKQMSTTFCLWVHFYFKVLLRNVGMKGQKTVFLITDTQIKEEAFLEDIDSVLNTGEVPNIFAADEKQEVMEVNAFYRVSLPE